MLFVRQIWIILFPNSHNLVIAAPKCLIHVYQLGWWCSHTECDGSFMCPHTLHYPVCTSQWYDLVPELTSPGDCCTQEVDCSVSLVMIMFTAWMWWVIHVPPRTLSCLYIKMVWSCSRSSFHCPHIQCALCASKWNDLVHEFTSLCESSSPEFDSGVSLPIIMFQPWMWWAIQLLKPTLYSLCIKMGWGCYRPGISRW